MGLMRNRFFQSIAAITVAYLAIVFFISQSPAGDSEAISSKLIEMSPDNRLDLLIQITGVNPLEGTAQARVLPWPYTNFGKAIQGFQDSYERDIIPIILNDSSSPR